MKTLVSLCTAVALVFIGASSMKAQETLTTDYFYETLSPYGDWVFVEDYGYCFQPFVTVEDPQWRPYTDGYWAYTDSGWTWSSNEDFGWACYHYGRWMKAGNNWLWVPGTEWSPGWVSWRSSSEYVGWAPLPPEAVWQQDVGFSVTVDTTYDIGPSYYSFVPIRHFGEQRLRTYVQPWQRNITLIQQTTNCTHVTYNDRSDTHFSRIYNGGPDYLEISRYTERPIRRLNIRNDDRSDFRDGRSRRSREDGDNLIVVAPRITIGERKEPPTQKIKTRLDRSAVDRGWRGVKAEDVGSVREKFKKEVAESSSRPRRPGSPDALPGRSVTGEETGRPPKALPAQPGDLPRTSQKPEMTGRDRIGEGEGRPRTNPPGLDNPGDRPPGTAMRRPGESEAERTRENIPGRPDSTGRARIPGEQNLPPGIPGSPGAKRDGKNDDMPRPQGRPNAGTDRPEGIPLDPTAGRDREKNMKPPQDNPGANRDNSPGREGRPEARRSELPPGVPGGPPVSRPGGIPDQAPPKARVEKPADKPDQVPPSREKRVMPPAGNENVGPKPERSKKDDDSRPNLPPGAAPRALEPRERKGGAGPQDSPPKQEMRRPDPKPEPRAEPRAQPRPPEQPRGESKKAEKSDKKDDDKKDDDKGKKGR